MATGRYHWSNCAPPARFFGINAIASVPWLALVLHPGWTTFYAATVVTAALIYIEVVQKMSVIALVRAINVWVTGRVKSTKSLIKEFLAG